MPDPRQTDGHQRLVDRLLAPSSGLQRRRWLVLVVAAAIEVILVLVVGFGESGHFPLDPVGAAVMLLSVVAGGLAGTLVGLGTALIGVAAAFALVADFGDSSALVNAAVSGLLWCLAATGTGLAIGHLRKQVARREAALKQALNRSLSTRSQLERVLDFAPYFHADDDLPTLMHTICQAAMDMFGADNARVFAVQGSELELKSYLPLSDQFKPGAVMALSDYPGIEEVLGGRRPSYQRDLGAVPLRGLALQMQHGLPIVSALRVPIVGAEGVIGLLSIGWDHALGRPSDELIATVQRFSDQAAIAWQTALRVEAERRADELHRTLDKVLALAPSFHITGAREKVAEAICEAAIETFGCTAASLYRVEGDRLRILARIPESELLPVGELFSLPSGSVLARELRARAPVFVPDTTKSPELIHPWPEETIRHSGTVSALYIPIRFNEHGPRNLLVFCWNEPQEEPDENSMVVIQRFADQASLALTNASAAQLHARLEASLLPSVATRHPGLDVFTRYRTGEQRLSLGGDFLGATVAEDGSLNFVLGDVSGHGPDAAALGATLRATWRALVLAGHDLASTLKMIDVVLVNERVGENTFATIVAGNIDLASHRLTLANAGHLPPLLIGGGVAVQLETPPSPPMGFADLSPPVIETFDLPKDWALMCYTDGLIDARIAADSPERFGEDRLIAHVSSWPTPGLSEDSIDELMRAIEAGNDGPFADDVAILVISTRKDKATVMGTGRPVDAVTKAGPVPL